MITLIAMPISQRISLSLKITALVLAVLIATIPANLAAAPNSNPRILPPNSAPHGHTYGEWSARWWQWTVSLPQDQNPSFDETGCANGANGQLGPVWFLTGVINVSGTVTRDCTVPAGKALFFPVINTECSTLEGAPFHGDNEAELRTCAKSFQLGDLFAVIDGVAVQDLDRYLVESPLFTFTVPPNNVLGVPAGTGQSVSHGVHLMLAPLSAGTHTIRFGGTYTDFSFSLDITYHLTVK
jgi:hypothetical protein